MPCSYKWKQLLNVTGALRELAPSSYISSLSGYTDLLNLRGQLLEQVLGPYPRIATLLGTITGLSPGSVKVWHDSENGWFAEGRVEPGAPPVYRRISAEDARALLEKNPDPDLAHKLMQPDTYAGE